MTSVVRQRNRGSLKAYTGSYTDSNGANNPYSWGFTGYTEGMTDTVTKGFKKISASGGIVMNPFYHTKRNITSEPGTNLRFGLTGFPSFWGQYNGNWSGYYLNWGGDTDLVTRHSLIESAEVDRMKTLVSTRCLSQIGRPKTDNWENLAEMDKTFTTLKAPFYSWFRYYYKLGDVGSAYLSSANLWLQMRYGLIPLMKSLIETVEQVKRNHKPERQTTRARDSISSASSSTASNTSSGVFRYDIGIQQTERHTVTAISVDEALFGRSLLHDFGFTAKGLWALPWELIPYSFIVDWFLNAGDYIGSLGNFFQEKSLGQCLVHTTESRYVRTLLSCASIASSHYVITAAAGSAKQGEYTWKSRTLGLSSPGIVQKSDFRLTSATRIGDACALVAQSVLMKFNRDPTTRRFETEF